MRDSKYLLPDNQETVRATEILAKEGFVVMPYMYPDLYTARDLVHAGAASVMPLASPIGSNKGLATRDFIQILIDEIDLPIIVDAGIGRPSQACEAMEMGRRRRDGEYRPCHGGGSSPDGVSFQECGGSRPEGVSGGTGQSADSRRCRLGPADRFSPGSGGRRNESSVFCRFRASDS